MAKISSHRMYDLFMTVVKFKKIQVKQELPTFLISFIVSFFIKFFYIR